jgi:CubicO group peptidase (beta-lactamase class C family)
MTAQIDDVLKRSTDRGACAGIVAAVGTSDGTIYEGSFGRRAIDQLVPMTVDTIFRIFSMTKIVGGVAAMKLVERGALDLDAPVEKYRPEFAELQVLEGFNGDKPILRAPKRKATVRQLMTHTSGLVYEFWNTNMAKYLEVTGNPSFLTGKKQGIMYPLAFDPGERWDYGVGIDWLGQVVEAVSGKRLDTFCRAEIFAPLNMPDTDFECEGSKRSRLASVHARQPDGSLTVIALDPPSHPEIYGAGYGLYSTAGDFMRFLRMLLNRGSLDGARILKNDTLDDALANHIGNLEIGNLKSVIPAVSCDAEFFPGMQKRHSLLGLINLEQPRGMRSAGSHCWAGALNTFFWFDPPRNIAGVLLMQSLPFVDPIATDVLVEFEKAVYAGL